MSSQKDYLREEAAQRAADIEAQRNAAAAVERARRERQSKKDLERKEALDALSSSQGAGSAHFARVAASDYTHNSARTMVAADGTPFLEPRWQPDEETENCNKCRVEFDFWWNRKHHCRHCGLIFCDTCSKERALLPVVFNKTDPQRVCGTCYTMLEPHQAQLSELISNAEKNNAVNLESGSLMRYCNLPFSLTLGSEIRKAAYSLHNLFESDFLEDKAIPAQLMVAAKGIAFLTVAKAGIGMAPKFGTGLVLSKLQDGSWSAPSAIATLGVSWGLLAGADLTDFVIILNTFDAVKAFSGLGNVQIGAGLDLAFGPVGRAAGGGIGISEHVEIAPALCYAHSKGLFAGVSLDGSLIMTRSDVNFKFYGRQYDPMELLFGNVPQPSAAAPLYESIAKHVSSITIGPGGAPIIRSGGASESESESAYIPRGSASTAPSGQAQGPGKERAGTSIKPAGTIRYEQQQRHVQQYDSSFFNDDDAMSSVNV
jgi:lipid-binding SYLF domain-containing protein